MVNAWDLENEVYEISNTLRNRYEKECLKNVTNNKYGVRKKLSKLKDQFEKTCFSLSNFFWIDSKIISHVSPCFYVTFS